MNASGAENDVRLAGKQSTAAPPEIYKPTINRTKIKFAGKLPAPQGKCTPTDLLRGMLRQPCPEQAGIGTYFHGAILLVNGKLFEPEIAVGHGAVKVAMFFKCRCKVYGLQPVT